MLHTFPDAREVVVAVREFLEREVMPGTTGTLSFQARVAANLLAALERELELGPAAQARYEQLLADLGVRDETELAERIRVGDVDVADPDLAAALHAMTTDRLLVWNPQHLSDDIDDDPRTATR
ncbi:MULTISPECIES: DUF6285 domain-containing protein [unclassified Blastococcus]